MKLLNIRQLAFFIALCVSTAACKKESKNIFNMFDVTLELHTDMPKSIGEYAEVNAGDSVMVDFTINSPGNDMYMVCMLKVGAGIPFIKIPITDEGKRRSYSDIIRLKADQGVGESTYRIWALDKNGVYLGDGYKKITINVGSDYRHLPNRIVYFPDTVGKSMNCYLSLTKGETYSYTTGAEHAADIDVAVYRKPVYDPRTGDQIGYLNNIYSLSASPNPFAPYDVSSWNKRKTLFSAPVTSGASTTIFRDLFKSESVIVAEAKKRTINLTQTTTGLGPGNFIYFLTPEGKYGVMLVNVLNDDYEGRPYMSVSIKMQP
jgi:hypothetical protein